MLGKLSARSVATNPNPRNPKRIYQIGRRKARFRPFRYQSSFTGATKNGELHAREMVMTKARQVAEREKIQTILVVDDDVATRKLISLILRQGGYGVLE